MIGGEYDRQPAAAALTSPTRDASLFRPHPLQDKWRNTIISFQSFEEHLREQRNKILDLPKFVFRCASEFPRVQLPRQNFRFPNQRLPRPSIPSPVPPVRPSNHHGCPKRPLTPPPCRRFSYYSTFPYSLELDQPIVFSHHSYFIFTLANNNKGCFVYFDNSRLQRSHSFSTFPSDKWRHYWQ